MKLHRLLVIPGSASKLNALARVPRAPASARDADRLARNDCAALEQRDSAPLCQYHLARGMLADRVSDPAGPVGEPAVAGYRHGPPAAGYTRRTPKGRYLEVRNG